RFYPGDRGDNIGLAASHLQGALIRSQATLSFNNIVGKRTRAAGYKNAGVIVNGEPAVDVGGGVCQVSSTLYNAILLAGLKPTERSNHSLPSSYVPAGRDATVADGLMDFVFQNPLPHPVVLRVSNSGSALTIYVLGTKADLGGKTISLVSEGPSTRPSVYRIWKQDGKVVEREFLHTDTF
ncbi:MAG: VanW family protein, partial [Selenomonas sp.]|nr:VanW family protein [Selenomonas sp.]